MFAQGTMFCLYHKINQWVERVSAVMGVIWKQEKKQMSLVLINLFFFRD